jgi:hypothetical protein
MAKSNGKKKRQPVIAGQIKQQQQPHTPPSLMPVQTGNRRLED